MNTMNKNSYEFIAAAVYSFSVDKRLSIIAEEQTRTVPLKFINKFSGVDIEAEDVLAMIKECGQVPEVEPTGNKVADDMIISATLLQLHGYKEQAINLFKHANYQFLYNRIEAEKIKNIEKVIKSSRQKAIAKKPRNPHYKETMRIAEAKWEKYPIDRKRDG